jgi:hypothetical protein
MVDTTNPLGASTTNPYGLTPSQQAWMSAVGGLGKGIDAATTPNSSGYMRANPPASFTPGNQTSAAQLLDTLLQMRQAETNRLSSPYQGGVGMPSVGIAPAPSLLRG